MEDPESEWTIQEYSPPPKEGETTMVKWILNKGYVIGKNMVITGIAITSAPLVLPPIAVFSAMGVAVSVPFGLVFASYVCTDTLMNRLLPPPPTPPPPLVLEYYVDEYEEGVDCKFDLYEGVDDSIEDYELEKESVMQEEEEEGILETEEKVEALNVDGDVDEKGYYTDDEEKGEEEEEEDVDLLLENLVQEDYGDLMEDYKQEIEALMMDENFDEKERVDHQDVVLEREYDIEEEEREQLEDLNQGIEMRLGFDMADDEHNKVSTTNSSGVDEQGYEEDDGEYLEEDDDSLQEERNKDEMEEIVVGNTGLLERTRDEGKIDDDEVEHESDLSEVFEEDKDVEMKEPVAVKDIESQKLVKEGGMDEEPVGEMHRVVILAEGNEENNFNSREIEELDLVAREVVGDTHKEERKMESDEKAMNDHMENAGGDTSNDGSEDVVLITKKEQWADLNEDARESGHKNGLDLFDETNTSMNFEILQGGDEVKENTADEHVEVMELSGFRDAPLDSDNVKVTCKTNTEVNTDSSGVNEQGYDEHNGVYLEGDGSLQEERNKKEKENNDEMEEIVKGSTGLLEKIRDEGKVHDEVEHEYGSNEVSEKGKDVEITELPLTVIEIESQKLVKDGSKNEERVGEMHRVVISAEGNEENNYNSVEVEELHLVEKKVVADMEKNSCKTSNDGSEDAILKTKKAHLIDLFDESNTSMNIETLKVDDEEKKTTDDDHVDVMALPGFRHATDRKTPSREDILEDEKIWEKIGAMRAIVGYKAPSQPTSIEELKALYVFTGVEPPASFKEDSDRDEVNAKLKFLMSIVGVK